MKQCPRCFAELPENVIDCEQCGVVLPLDFWTRGTVAQESGDLELDDPSSSSEELGETRPSTIRAADRPGTLNFDPVDAVEDSGEIVSIELDESQDDYESGSTFQATDDFEKTQFFSTDAREVISRTNIAADRDPVESDDDLDNSKDQTGTARFSSEISNRSSSENTIGYDSQYPDRSTHEAGSSGSEGRYRRLWKGHLGSSQDPMHSLVDSGLEATGRIFERVVQRRVSNPNEKAGLDADYQIGKKLGEGAMGLVYSARQFALNRTVAFKTAKPQFQENDSARRQFLYEAQITAELDHSNIVPIYELGASSDGKLFYSMKLIDGTEWIKVMRQNSLDRNLDIFTKVADAVAYAHAKGIIHRDLKPENTMLSRYGEVFVTDWGTAINLSKMVTRLVTVALAGERKLNVEDAGAFSAGDRIVIHDGETVLARCDVQRIDPTDPNQLCLRKPLDCNLEPSPKLKVSKQFNPVAGTPCYMAPEMAEGSFPKIGKTCDIYVLGGILFDMVTGRPPHVGKSKQDCLFAALENQIVKPKSSDPLLNIAYRALETDPKDRFPSIEAMQDAIREYRRNAESITISKQAAENFQRATTNDDYELFNRSIFGYQNALDLWAENTTASAGLNEARLTFMQTASKRGDYDLVIQTANPSVEAEAELVSQATKAKNIRDSRERSLKLLKRVATAIVLCSLVALTGLSVVTYRAYLSADKLAVENFDLLVEQEKLTASEKSLKDTAKEDEERIKKLLEKETNVVRARDKAIELQDEAIKDKDKAFRAQTLAIKGQEKALALAAKSERSSRSSAQAAQKAAVLANRRAAQVQLGEYAASLTLAKSRLDSFDVGSSRQILNQLEKPPEELSKLFSDSQPRTTNWGWNRASLLSNSDLKTVQLGGRPTAMDCVPGSGTAVVAMNNGQLSVLREQEGALQIIQQRPADGSRINALSLAPNAEHVVFASNREGVASLVDWNFATNSFTELPESKQRAFQCMAFSKDNKYLLAGINGGIWVWQTEPNRTGGWKLTGRSNSIRGACENIIQLNENQFLVGDRFEKKLLVGVLTLAKNAESEPNFAIVPLDEELSSQAASISSSDDGSRIYFGMPDGTLRTGQFDPADRKLTELRIIETQHRAPIDRFVVGKSTLISSSENEPIVHVWGTSGDFRYDTYLAGTSSNIQRVGLISDSKVLLVDRQGTALVLGIERQKQRRRLASDNNSAPIIGTFAGSFRSDALTIDQNGVVDLWSLENGKSAKLASNRWSYFGHTPGASYVDSAIDSSNGLLITSAKLNLLTEEQRKYLAEPSHQWEFCLWDQKTGNMLRRWSETNRPTGIKNRFESIEQRLSLVNQGLLFASDVETRLVDPRTGSVIFRKTNFGTYFAVPNPKRPSWTMLVKRNGAVKLVDFGVPTTWDSEPNVDSTYNDDAPIKGQWSPDGNRFYLLWASGGLTVFQSDSNPIEDIWSSRVLTKNSRLAQALLGNRPQSHCDVDLNVCEDGEDDLVQFAIRDASSKSTKKVAVRFELPSANSPKTVSPKFVSEETLDSIQWLESNTNGLARFIDRVHDRIDIDPSRLRARSNANGLTFVSISNAHVIAVAPGKTVFDSYGRDKLVSATGCKNGKQLFSLHEDGTVWSFAIENEKGVWVKTKLNLPEADLIHASPNGSKLLVVSAKRTAVYDVQEGKAVEDYGQGTIGCWDSNSPERLVVCSKKGEVSIVDGALKRVIIEDAQLPVDSKVRGLHFFQEAWSDPTKLNKEYVLIHVESASTGQISFVPLTEANDAELAEGTENLRKWSDVPSNCVLATSPKESIFLTGSDQGTVQLWMASPSWDPNSRALFELEGHRGSKITNLCFSADGKTVITADSNRRLFGWMSEDPMTVGMK